MNKTLRIILITIGIVVLTAYLLWAMYLIPDSRKEVECEKVYIEILDTLSRQFINSREVASLLRDSGLYPAGEQYKNINTQTIEDAICKNQVVRNAECYKLTDGSVYIQVEQREPRLRVIGEKNYYIDADRLPMRATFHTATYVPVITGRVTEKMAKNELFDFVEWLSGNDFWNAQIEQINVNQKKEIELVPRVGGHTILLGTLEDYDHKLNKLQQFYTEGLSKIGWKDYSEIDLRFKNQVIGRK